MKDEGKEKKLTPAEKSWVLYDVANSAFTLIVTATIPIYFRGLAESGGVSGAYATSLWGTSVSISVLILAVLSPILGAIADYQNMKKKIFTVFLALAVTGAVCFTFAPDWLGFLLFFIAARLGYAACNIFYDAMLVDVTTDERMDRISTLGFAWGYIGSCVPFILGILLILLKPFGLDTMTATRISFLITILWWVGMSLPLFLHVHQNYYVPGQPHVIAHTFHRLGATFGKLKRDKKLLFFILGYFFYIDGVYTIISMATTYGGEVGVDDTSMILALLLTQFVAFPCSIASGTLAKKFGTIRMIKIFIVMYMGICAFGYGLDTEAEFWILAVAVGVCQGGIQALSRSYFGKLIPKEESSEYFGFFDIFGKFADFFGPLLIAVCAALFGNSRYGIFSLIALFALGFVLLLKSERQDRLQKGLEK